MADTATMAAGTDSLQAIIPTMDDVREPVFVLLAKRTYNIVPGKAPSPTAEPVPLTLIDRYHDDGDPQTTTVEHEAENAPYKLATDFVVIAAAHAPDGQPVRQLDVAVEIGTTRKQVRVFGDRGCEHLLNRAPRVKEPLPFTTMPLRYERAYGGIDTTSVPDGMFMYPRNPRGTGIIVANRAEAVNALRLPNLEDPADLLTPERLILGEPEKWPGQPLPQGLGWFPKIAYPRCSLVGSLPAYVGPGVPLKEEGLGLVPKNQIALGRQFRLPSYDVRFNHGASLGLSVPFLDGGEAVRLTNLTPDGQLSFALPRERPTLALDIGAGLVELTPVLHTACVRVAAMQLDIIWRGALRYPGVESLAKMQRLAAEVIWP